MSTLIKILLLLAAVSGGGCEHGAGRKPEFTVDTITVAEYGDEMTKEEKINHAFLPGIAVNAAYKRWEDAVLDVELALLWVDTERDGY